VAIGTVTCPYAIVLLLLNLGMILAELDLLVPLHRLVLLDLVHEHLHLLVALLQLGLRDLELLVDSRDFTLLLVKYRLQLFLELFLIGLEVIRYLLLELVLLLVELLDLLVEDLNVQFQLLLDLDMVSDFSLILLELLLVFFGRQIN
jgi:hypothetical protein